MRSKIILFIGLLLLFIGATLLGLLVLNNGKLPLPDVSVTCENGGYYCGSDTCPDGTYVPEDDCTPPGFADCKARYDEACQNHQGGGGSTNVCSSSAPTPAGCYGKSPGQLVPYDGGTCECQFTTGDWCACVPVTGTVCSGFDSENVSNSCTNVGASCKNSAGQLGTCMSDGVSDQLDQDDKYKVDCKCQIAANQPVCGNGICESGENNSSCASDCPSNQTECTRRTDCPSGMYCNNYTCTNQLAGGQSCQSGTTNSANDVCLTLNCEFGNCTRLADDCSFDTDCSNGQICEDRSKTCVDPKPVNADCTYTNECQTGLQCINLRCRAIVDDSDPNVACVSGRYYCDSSICPTGGEGKLCNNGTIANSQCTKADACAYQVQPVVNNQSCAGLKRLSGGESSKGGFVGCSGAQNCFCPELISIGTTYSSGTVSCYDDIYGDSCGAGDQPPITTVETAVCYQACSSVVPCVDGTQCINGLCRNPDCQNDSDCSCETTPPPEENPFCGDSICQSGELCERISSGSNTYIDCTTNEIVSECRGIVNQAPSAANSCTYCGDGILNGGEQCDYNAPGTVNCNTSCQNEVSACVSLSENGPDPIISVVGNYVEYTLLYNDASIGNPYPNIKLVVGTIGNSVGRDANNNSSNLVSPFVSPSANDSSTQKMYKFLWEAINVNGSALPDADYDVQVLLEGNATSLITTPACTEDITVDSETPPPEENVIFSIIKEGSEVCLENGNVRIDYTINVTNYGDSTGVIESVIDQLDSDLVPLGIIPTNINPTFGTYNNGVITWIGSELDRTFAAGQTKTYTYSLLIPLSNRSTFSASGVDNEVTVRYDDGISSHRVNVPMKCTYNKIPETAIFDDPANYIILGSLLLMLGLVAFKITPSSLYLGLSEKLSAGKMSRFENSIIEDIKQE